MTDEATNLVLEHLRHIRARVDAIDIRLDELTGRVGRIEQVLVTLVQSYADVNKHLDRSDERLARIERRLDLTNA
jgi:DNA repair ATPase RecN